DYYCATSYGSGSNWQYVF
nr:immunoglobulin light chain junction region [Macaca mulatta]MOY16158.1 immunoglobulin light chain junction region [Macaca mulatta]MOY16212.1 immunoglobulin light chain junction region [Macaca mulatta]MOY16593.1 immunoglobulin light chain junction region [Macaca mulatta]MOY17378.1 immunoglobulin light chain junction region [Macaca mulatta]